MDYKIGLMGNFVIRGKIEARTGLHIGASADTVEIGGIDSPVIKHPKTGEPYIPGSSVKGKMRSFMEKITYAANKDFQFNRDKGPRGIKLMQHECRDLDFSYVSDDNMGAKKCPVCRVYGSTGEKVEDIQGRNHPSRIVVRDCILSEEDKEKIMDETLYVFEAKMENAIDRMTAAAHPRTFERVPQGAMFGFEIVYKAQGEFENSNGTHKLKQTEIEFIRKDIQNIFEVLSLIEKDGLGGSTSRGYGQVAFELSHEQCKYYRVGGGAEDFLPAEAMESPTPLEVLRKHEFAELTQLILGA